MSCHEQMADKIIMTVAASVNQRGRPLFNTSVCFSSMSVFDLTLQRYEFQSNVPFKYGIC